MSKFTLGATYLGENLCSFMVWAPLSRKIDVHITYPQEKMLALSKDSRGYHYGIFGGISAGSKYYYRLDSGNEYPDPASRFQSDGVHQPSLVVDSSFNWNDQNWFGISLSEYIIYELHVGTFTNEGTFDAIIPHLDKLKELDITAVELMPVAQFPGSRNWGYDGVYPYAVQNSYGGPEGLKRLVNACHAKGIAVIMDVVYNHIGPEGNYFEQFGPYFTERYLIPWGKAINFDGAYSDEVRYFFIENALYWLTEMHIDALRLDALHAIFDISPRPFLQELAEAVKQLREETGRRLYLIGESDANDRRCVSPPEIGGYGLDAQWNDDFHHELHVLLTGEKKGYYQGFGQLSQMAKSLREGFIYSGEYSSFRKRRHGSSSRDIPASRFVVFSQNHDQIGNRMLGERLSNLVSFEGLKLAAGNVLLSPFLPLLFMGEEYGETAPFQYFTSHSETALIEAVRKGRREEFNAFDWEGECPDPQAEITFLKSKINHDLCTEGQHKILFSFYKELIRLRKKIPALTCLSKDDMEVLYYEKSSTIFFRRWVNSNEAIIVFNFGNVMSLVTPPIDRGQWNKILDSADKKWLGRGSKIPRKFTVNNEVNLNIEPQSLALFVRMEDS